MKKWFLVVILLSFLTIGGTPFDKDYESALYNDFSGGINLFSSPATVKDNQALHMENLLFYGSRFRARKGVDDLQTTEIARAGITGVHRYKKSGEFSQILAVCGGLVWVYDEDSDTFDTFLKFTTDTAGSVFVTQNDSTVKGYETSYTSLGYRDSIPILLNDSLHYIYQIMSDTLIYLYDKFLGDTDTTAEFTKPFLVDRSKPTQFDTWLDYEFIPGLYQLGKYDGTEFDTTTVDTTEYTIDTVYKRTSSVLYIVPTSSFGIQPGEWDNYYVIAYNDTATSPKLNIPLRIQASLSSLLRVYADTTWITGGHLDSVGGGQTFKVIPPLPLEQLVYAGIVDSVDTSNLQTFSLYDTSQTWALNEFNYGHYVIREPDTNFYDRSVIRIRNDGTYDYLYISMASTYWTLAKGDSFEVYRLCDGTLTEAPQLVCHYQDRQWRAGYVDDPNIIKYSNLFDPDTFPGTHYIYIVRDDGDVLTAIVPLAFQDCILAFKNKYIYSITGEGPFNWWVNALVEGIGTPSQSTVISYGRNVYFYDYTGWYKFDGLNPQKISWAIEDIVADSINKDYAHLIVGEYFDQHLWWSYPSGTARPIIEP